MTKSSNAWRYIFAVLGIYFFALPCELVSSQEIKCKPQECTKGVTSIHHIGKNGIVINKPGSYRFANDITVNLNHGESAITINANNVFLDLNHFTLKQLGAGKNNHGILVTSCHHTVTISQGTIEQIHGFGIKVEKGNEVIQLKDLIVQNCGACGSDSIFNSNEYTGGILFLGCLKQPIKDIVLTQCSAVCNRTSDPQVGVNGLLMVSIEKAFIDNCHFSDNVGPSEISVAGAHFFQTKDVEIQNCFADQNSNTPASGINAECFGFHFNAPTALVGDLDSTEHVNIKVSNTTANRTFGKVNRAAGFRFRRARNIVVTDSVSHQTMNTAPDSASVNPTVTAAAGFLMSICDDFTIQNCQAYEHSTTHASSRVVGGFDAVRCTNGWFFNCHAARCSNQGGDGTFGGFILEPALALPEFSRSVGIVFEQCVSEGNIGSQTPDGLGGGFRIAHADAVKIIDSEAIANVPNGIDIGSIIAIDQTLDSLIKDNIVMSNRRFGILDHGPFLCGANSNVYLGNVGRNNPIANFRIPLCNPVIDWRIATNSPLPPSTSNDNISIE